ncbi:MAG: four-helix bundle copper-binding protein [Rubrivivax sp.]|nr:MAG: four-helix bundle copper-binding protein [Rubrivivax sp.]
MHHHDTQQDFDECIRACQAALQACQVCVSADVRESHEDMENCILINLDCADMCEATIKVLARQSPHHGDFCAVCTHLCRACAAECAKHDHEHCQRCRAACEQCAHACGKHASEGHSLGAAG